MVGSGLLSDHFDTLIKRNLDAPLFGDNKFGQNCGAVIRITRGPVGGRSGRAAGWKTTERPRLRKALTYGARELTPRLINRGQKEPAWWHGRRGPGSASPPSLLEMEDVDVQSDRFLGPK